MAVLKSDSFLRWLGWALTCVFLFYEYFFRASPSVIVPELIQAFGVSAAAIGALSAFYFYVYAPMQIPVGMLLDYFGARRLLTVATAVCGLGGILFGISYAYWLAAVGRVLMGLGSSFAFIGMVYVSSHWFPPNRRALLVGLGNSAASLGSVFGEGPLAAAVGQFGWRSSLIAMGIIGLLLAVVMYIVMRRDIPYHTNHPREAMSMWSCLKTVCRNVQTWINGAVALLSYVTTGTFASLWGVPFLVQTHHISEEAAGFAVSMIFIGWMVGGPIVGSISDRAGNRRLVLRICLALAFLVLAPVVYATGLKEWMIFVLMFLVGAFSSGQLLNFSIAIEINPFSVKGTATSFTNFLVAGANAIVQPLVGLLLEAASRTPRTTVYTERDYRIALTLFPAAMLLAFIISFFIKSPKIPPIEQNSEIS